MRKQMTLVALLIAGCVSSTGVQSLGQGTYRVEAGSEFGLAQAQQRALQEASQYCQSFGGPSQKISSRAGSRLDALGDTIQTYELIFRCAGSGQPTYSEGPAYPPGSPPPPYGHPPPPSGYPGQFPPGVAPHHAHFAVVCLRNRTAAPIRFERRWGPDPWIPEVLNPNQQQWYAFEFQARYPGLSPAFHVKFDQLMGPGTLWTTKTLGKYSSSHKGCEYGRRYDYIRNAHGEVQLIDGASAYQTGN